MCTTPIRQEEAKTNSMTIYIEHVYGESNLISHHIDCIPQFTFQIFLCSQSLEPTNDLIDCECLWSKQFWLALQPSALGWLRILQNTEHALSQLDVWQNYEVRVSHPILIAAWVYTNFELSSFIQLQILWVLGVCLQTHCFSDEHFLIQYSWSGRC